MAVTDMTSKERIVAAVEHRQPDRVPIMLDFAPEAKARLQQRLGLDEQGFWQWCGQDIGQVSPSYRKAVSDVHYADPTIEVTADERYLDIWRVPFRQVRLELQTYVELAGLPPLAQAQTAADLDRHPWPSPDDWDYSNIPGDLAANARYAVRGHSRGFFEISHFMRGMEDFLADLVLQPDFACDLMDRIASYLLDRSSRILQAGGGQYTIFEYNDDVASQRGLFVSPDMWRQYISPRVAPFCDLAHQHGAKLRYHCCGSCREIIPDLIEIGVDILNPVQPLADGMDPFELKRLYGDRITFDGGIDIQQLLPNASPTEVRAHTHRMIDLVGREGGYILGGSHSIQTDCPDKNVIAMVDEAMRR
jgi:uroporphyrinogen decarboxylase